MRYAAVSKTSGVSSSTATGVGFSLSLVGVLSPSAFLAFAFASFLFCWDFLKAEKRKSALCVEGQLDVDFCTSRMTSTIDRNLFKTTDKYNRSKMQT